MMAKRRHSDIPALLIIVVVLLLFISVPLALADVKCDCKIVDIAEERIEIEGIIGGTTGATISEYPRDIIICLDNSGSMAQVCNGKTRLDWCKGGITSFIADMEVNIHVGIVTFSQEANLEIIPTSDNKLITECVNNISIVEGKTNLGDSILLAIDALSNRKRNSMPLIVLLTDGNYETGPDPINAATDAAKRNMVIHAVGIGDETNEFPLRTHLNISSFPFFN